MIIMYAEDDPEDVELFREVVSSINSQIGCIVARDGLDALDMLENAIVLPDFIFLDVNMPLLGGQECLRRIKQNKALRAIPVIIYTTSRNPEDIQICRQLGAHDYIIKPNMFEEACERLKSVLFPGS